MSVISQPAQIDEVDGAEPRRRKPWSAMKVMLVILGALVAINWTGHLLFAAPDQITAAATYPIQPADSARADAVAFQKQIAQVTMHCEFESASLSIAMMGSDPVSGYGAAKNTTAACGSVRDSLGELNIPQTLGRAVAQAYAAAIKVCQSAYSTRANAAYDLQAALDTGGKVSALADLRRDMGEWKDASRACDAAISAAPTPLGLTRDDLAAAIPGDDDQAASSGPTPSSTPAVELLDGFATPAEHALLQQNATLDIKCRDADDQHPMTAECTARDRTFERLEKIGWCLGRPGEFSAEQKWHHCHETRLEKLPERQARWLAQCEQALAKDVPQPDRVRWPQLDAASEVVFNQRSALASSNGPDVVLSFLVRLADAPGNPVAGFATCGFKDNYDADGGVSLVSHRI